MSFFKDYFYFSRSERNGTIILVSIIILEILFLKYSYLFVTHQVVDYSKYEKEIDDFKKSKITKSKNNKTDTVFYFNPNNTSAKDWKLLGLNDKQIKIINNYLSKGGKFYKPEDFKKIYGITDSIYNKLKNYISINENNNKLNDNKRKEKLFYFDPNTATANDLKKLGFNKYQIKTIIKFRKKGGNFKQPKDLLKIYGIKKPFYNKIKKYIKIDTDIKNNQNNNIVIEINSANETELQKINGIGKTFASRIIKYRKLLGGFYSKNQLTEVYGIDKEKLTEISNQIKIDTLKIKKININTADFKTIIKHPYINKSTTSKILDYRKFAKKIKSYKELIKNNVLLKSDYKKLRPYLLFE